MKIFCYVFGEMKTDTSENALVWTWPLDTRFTSKGTAPKKAHDFLTAALRRAIIFGSAF